MHLKLDLPDIEPGEALELIGKLQKKYPTLKFQFSAAKSVKLPTVEVTANRTTQGFADSLN